MRIKVKAGPHRRLFCPVEIGDFEDLPDSFFIRDEENGAFLPAQEEDGKIVFIIPYLDKGEERTYEIVEGKAEERVELKESDSLVEVLLGGKVFTSYHIDANFPRPFLYPLYAPGQIPITRSYPMEDVEGESKDHKHHRSLWVAHGDVNGVDNWSEEEGHGRQIHKFFKEIKSGIVRGSLREVLDWVDAKGKKVLEEEREIIFYNLSSPIRMIDFRIVFYANEKDVIFGDTKEGGIISLRVASELEGNRGGVIENSFGGIGEREAWGKRAHWCDYWGYIKGEKLGVAVLDNPSNLRHPTYWHIRDYGLFTANPFGVSYFTNNPLNRGDYKLSKGEKLEFRYRLIIHKGSAEEASIKEHFLNYAFPPEVVIER
jgi:hypothetical protein